jgi:hypothetical protein
MNERMRIINENQKKNGNANWFYGRVFRLWERFRMQKCKAQKSLTKGRKLPLAESNGAAPQTTTFCATKHMLQPTAEMCLAMGELLCERKTKLRM